MKCNPALLILFSLCLFPFSAWSSTAGEGQGDCVLDTVVLGNAEVKAYRDRTGMRYDDYGSPTWDMKMLKTLPKIMGNADPMRYLQMMPGVQTNGEYLYGINVQGCESGHNMVSIEGMPLYNVNHLLGFFSTFNATHYADMRLERTPSSGFSPNRVGANVDFSTPSGIDSIGGDFSVGLISSQGTLYLPLGKRKKMSLTLSGRTSYINLLYSKWLEDDYRKLDYRFHDLNLTWTAEPAEGHTLKADFYYGSDKGNMKEKVYEGKMRSRWGNMALGLQWQFAKSGWKTTQHLWASGYRNRFVLRRHGIHYSLPSGIGSAAYKGEVSKGKWMLGVECIKHGLDEQQLFLLENEESSVDITTKNAYDAAVYAGFRQPLAPTLDLDLGLRGSIFRNEGHNFKATDPSAALIFEKDRVHCTLSYALRHQFLHFTGITDAGLPIEYWMGANAKRPPQYAHSLALNFILWMFKGRYRVDVGAFGKHLKHQIAYNGGIYDCIETDFRHEDHIFSGKGRNYGVSMMLTKCSGRLTGWLNYSYTSAKRWFDMGDGFRKSPASHERPHELDAVVSYTLSRKWSLGANVVYASGTPYTSSVDVELEDGNVVTQYGPYNACRMSPYFRTDVSVNYKWEGKGRTEQGINFSVYNVTFHKNDMFYSLRSHQDGSFEFVPTNFCLRALPSISYYIKF